MNRGYVKFWRKSLDSGILANADVWQVFSYLLLNASHKEYTLLVGNTPVKLKPGQLVTGRDALAQKLCSTQKKIRTALDTLEKMQIIGRERASKYSIISVINWGIYQEQGPAEGQQQGHDRANRGPAEGQQRATNNNIEHKTREEEEEEREREAPPPTAAPPPEKNIQEEHPPDVIAFVQEFQQKAKELGGNMAPAITSSLIRSGCQEVSRMIRLDGFMLERIKQACYWALTDSFWSQNVRALSQMRKVGKNGLRKIQNVMADYEKQTSQHTKQDFWERGNAL